MFKLQTCIWPIVQLSWLVRCKLFLYSILIFDRFNTLVVFVVSAISSSPIVFVFIAIYIWLSFKVQRYYMKLLREVTRLKGVSSSPVVQNFKEGIEGVSTIRTHGNQEKMFDNYLLSINGLQKNNISIFAAKNWFKLRVSIMSLIIVIPCILVAVSLLNKF